MAPCLPGRLRAPVPRRRVGARGPCPGDELSSLYYHAAGRRDVGVVECCAWVPSRARAVVRCGVGIFCVLTWGRVGQRSPVPSGPDVLACVADGRMPPPKSCASAVLPFHWRIISLPGRGGGPRRVHTTPLAKEFAAGTLVLFDSSGSTELGLSCTDELQTVLANCMQPQPPC